jgi:hypothetical protein
VFDRADQDVTELADIDRQLALLELDGDREAYATICAGFQKQLDRAMVVFETVDIFNVQPALKAIHELITSAHIVGARKASVYLRHCESLLVSGELTQRSDVESVLDGVRGLLAALRREAAQV